MNDAFRSQTIPIGAVGRALGLGLPNLSLGLN